VPNAILTWSQPSWSITRLWQFLIH